MRERDNKGRFMKNGSEKAEKKLKKGERRSDVPSLKWLKKKGFISFFALTGQVGPAPPLPLLRLGGPDGYESRGRPPDSWSGRD